MNNERPLKTQPLCGQNQLPYKSPDWLFYGWRLTCTKWGMTDELILHSFISTTGLWGQTLLLLSALKLVSDTYAGIWHTAYGMSLFNMKLKVKWLDEVQRQIFYDCREDGLPNSKLSLRFAVYKWICYAVCLHLCWEIWREKQMSQVLWDTWDWIPEIWIPFSYLVLGN